MSVELLQPSTLFDGVTGIVHYETTKSTLDGSFDARAEEVTREISDANYSAWCDATGSLGGLPDLWIWESDPALRAYPLQIDAIGRMRLALESILVNCRPAYDWDSRPVSQSAEAAFVWLATIDTR